MTSAATTNRAGADRRTQVADAALAVLASQGARGLTHRAVDEEADLPQGSTSNVFRSRAALLEGALNRHAEIDLAAAGPPDARLDRLSHAQAGQLLTAAVEAVLEQRSLTVARYELLLESTRRPELREPIRAARRRFAERAASFLTAAGCAHPERHAKQLLAVLDGVVVAELHGREAALDRDSIAELIDRQLASC